MPKQSWFTLALNAADATMADMAIYDVIGGSFFGGVTAEDFRNELNALPDTVSVINISLNSPGGEVFDGIAIYNMLARHKATVNVTIDGLAASIASLVAAAGDTVTMPENSMMMMHNPMGIIAGDAGELRGFADALDKMREAMITSYVAKSGLKRDEVAAIMDAETWFTAQEAKDRGFADAVSAVRQITNRFDLSRFPKVPAAVAAAIGKLPDPAAEAAAQAEADAAAAAEAAAQAEAAAVAARAEAEAAAAREAEAAASAAGNDPAEAVAAATAGERKRAADITAACTMAGHPGKIAGFIEGGKAISDVLAELATLPRGSKDNEANARHSTATPEAKQGWNRQVERINKGVSQAARP